MSRLTIGQTGMARFLSWLLPSGDPSIAEVTAKKLTLTGRTGSKAIALENIDRAEVVNGPIWDHLSVAGTFGEAKVPRLDRSDATRFVKTFRQVLRWHRILSENEETLRKVDKRIEHHRSPCQYFRTSEFEQLVDDAKEVHGEFPPKWPDLLNDLDTIQMLANIRKTLKKPKDFRKDANEHYFKVELAGSGTFFNSIEAHSLTEEQRRAIIADDDRNLVVAAAGSGKTSLIVAKVAWLLKKGYRQAPELLVLVYSRAAKEELESRIREQLPKELATRITVKTFHGLGRQIIQEVTGEHPPLSQEATEDKQKLRLLRDIVDVLLQNPKFANYFRDWLQWYFAPYRSHHECDTHGQYWAYLKRRGVRSLKGESVRSFEECQIANFLFLSGIDYTYKPGASTSDHTDDELPSTSHFRLLDSARRIEIHFFPLSESREMPRFFSDRDRKLLNQRIENVGPDVIRIHTYSHEHGNGTLIKNLAENLCRHNVVGNRIPDEMLCSALDGHGSLRPFLNLLASFLRHVKGSGVKARKVIERASEAKNRARANCFLALFDSVYRRYQERLRGSNAIDYDDMINHATHYVNNYREDAPSEGFRSPFTYVLVDEFQDISMARAGLLKALLRQRPAAQLFAVGDDWQSILRFTGSDVGIMWAFANHFGASTTHALETSFRCPASINEVARAFILKNKKQLPKTVRSHNRTTESGVHIYLPEFVRPPRIGKARGRAMLTINPEFILQSPLRRALDDIDEDASRRDRTPDVLVLGRYKNSKPDNWTVLKTNYPRLHLTYRTIHSSKGLGADYVVVLGLSSDAYGFPSEFSDDPLLNLVLAAPEPYPHAEERRLFYVALTRAKRRVFLLAEDKPLSPFLLELLTGNYAVDVSGQAPQPDAKCERCIEGRLTKRTRPNGTVVYKCSHRPYCSHRQRSCPNCGQGLPVESDDGAFRCRTCRHEYRACPNCNGGWLYTKNPDTRPFIGCANWPVCAHTEQSRQPRNP